MRAMKLLLLSLLLLTRIAGAGLDDHEELLMADVGGAKRVGAGDVRITYLGVNGYQLEAGGHALLVDPYFTRVGLGAVGFGARIEPDEVRVREALSRLRPRVDAVLVTHAHFDHLLDVPPIMRQTGARLVAGPTAVNLVRSLGIRASQCRPVRAGAVRRIGPWTIRVLAAEHDRIFSSLPYPGTVESPARPPVKPSDWVLGEPLAFIIEAAGQRIYIDSGGMPRAPLPRVAGKVDMAILGVALVDGRRRFARIVRHLQPRFVLPSHQDDFFAPWERGFAFGKFTDFPEVRRTFDGGQLPGRLILLDYFRPWTLR